MPQPKVSRGTSNLKTWLTSSFDVGRDESPAKPKRPRLETTTIADSISKCSVSTPARKNLSSLPSLLEACNPRQPSESAISRQKQKEICDWLDYRTTMGKPCALILSGPSGCGKTVGFQLLANERDFECVEWITPVDQYTDENNFAMRQSDVFEDYLIRATRYRSVIGNYSRRILLVKDFPNVYMRDKEAFESTLEKYFQMGKEPLVFICGDTGGIGILQTLFPENIRKKFNIDHISVKSVTQAATKNILKRISTVLNSRASDMVYVSQAIIDEILSNNIGDIRSTVLNLIFSSLKVPNCKTETDSKPREESLGLLHAIGRVINPKRVYDGDSWKFVHDPDEIAFFFQSQPTTFVGFIHENYLNTIRTIEEATAAAHIISTADCLTAEWRDENLGRLGLSYCIRGIMLSNEKPVSGWNPVRKPHRNDAKASGNLASAEIKWYQSLINPQLNDSSIGSSKD